MPEIVQLATKIYILTENSFTKKEYAESERQKNIHGKPTIWNFGRQRLKNEYNALQLIANQTTIPGPKVINFGEDEVGATFLEVERIYGLECSDVGEKCRMPEGQAHVSAGYCPECERIAVANVDRYMQTVAIPQLQTLKSSQTGLDGFVLPPPRIEQYDPRAVWLPRQSQKEDEYVFCHGDLSRFNIVVDARSLEVKCIFDWEHAGHYPPSIELPLWRFSNAEYMATYEDKVKIEEEIALIQ